MNTITAQSAWRVLVKRYQLTELQEELFKKYAQLLQQANQVSNITAITTESDIISLHFDDSLAITRFVDLTQCKGIADVGSGGGFPGIPLKIMFPDVPLFLIEVSNKKRAFLERVVSELQLTGVHVVALDWRTFLRKTNFSIDIFCARASLEVGELIRMFKPSSPYKQAQLMYWASCTWKPEKQVIPYIIQHWNYHVAGRERRVVMLARHVSNSSIP